MKIFKCNVEIVFMNMEIMIALAWLLNLRKNEIRGE